MNEHDEVDPFAELRDWGKKTERKVRRERQVRGAGKSLRYVVMAGVAGVMIAATVPVVRALWPAVSASADDTPAAAASSDTSPFTGTAAANYPIGEAGIVLPEVKAVTGFSATEVRTALNTVRAALVAGRLDEDTLVRHRKDEFLGLLAPNDRTSVAKWFGSASFGTVVTWIDPAVTLDPANRPRVSGRVTYKSVVDDGIRTIRVTTNFVWVYAFQGEFAFRPLAVEHEQVDWEFPDEDKVRPGDRGMWIGANTSYHAWIDFAAAKKGLLAPTPKDAGAGLPNAEDQESLAKPEHPLDIRDNCT
ncbi:hypothetical protein [Actinoplanes palleronii]|uniref:Uncharacterized protein n=1 Tax=Actinoplanes palleronii TaxID=113570 RepID=A0ABQ4BCD3_9ACTN|nr:hypothetical protein [Actinoplanes palleronii]GIE68309.1 hypothetical protein Apa02nite_044170 [Actinoplanes palleronii]